MKNCFCLKFLKCCLKIALNLEGSGSEFENSFETDVIPYYFNSHLQHCYLKK